MPNTVIAPLEGEGDLPLYIAEPAGAPRGGIIVIPEIFGVNPGIRAKVDHWASLGYLAAALDIFWRVEPGVELSADVPEEFQKGVDLMMKTDQVAVVKDIEATIKFLRAKSADTSGKPAKVGVVGYCFGGRLAYLTAARTDADASVGYYGVGLDGLLDEAPAIGKPLLLHIAKADHFVLPDAQAAIHAGLDGNPHVTLHDYDGEDHGFAAEDGSRRSEAAKQLADGRTEAFFAANVG